MENQNTISKRSILVKSLVASLAFVALNVALVISMMSRQEVADLSVLAPTLHYAGAQAITVKTPYALDFIRVTDGSVLVSGSQVKSGENSFAEIKLGPTTVRMEPATEIALSVSDRGGLNVNLKSGILWVDADLPVIVKTSSSYVTFDQSMGFVDFRDGTQKIAVLRGLSDLLLLDTASKSLASFVIPFRHEIYFHEEQLIEAYRALKVSKLAKELHLKPLDLASYSDPWILAHLNPPLFQVPDSKKGIVSDWVYTLKNDFYSWRAQVALSQARAQALHFDQLGLQLHYVLGVLQIRNNPEGLNTVFDTVRSLQQSLAASPLYIKTLEEQWSRVRGAPLGTAAQQYAQYLEATLFELKKDPAIFRSDLNLIDQLLAAKNTSSALRMAQSWKESWTEDLRSTYLEEFSIQQRLYAQLMVAHAPLITLDLLSVLDQTGATLLTSRDSEWVLEVTQQRLNVIKSLLASYRYTEAKVYLKASYQTLALDPATPEVAARDIFVSEAELIAERIAFAEEELHGAARPIDETAFNAYLESEQRQNYLTSVLEELAAPTATAEPASLVEAPSVSEIVTLLLAAEIQVTDDQVVSSLESPYEYLITGAKVDAHQMDATYDSKTKALFDIQVDGNPYKGSFALTDFVTFLRRSAALDLQTVSTPSALPSEEEIAELLNPADEASREEAVARDLAIQLLLKEMTKVGIQVSSAQKIAVVGDTLTQFRISEASVPDPKSSGRSIRFSFEYDLLAKTASKIYLSELGKTLSDTPALDQVSAAVLYAVNLEASKVVTLDEILRSFKAKSIVLGSRNIQFTSDALDEFTFMDAKMATLPIQFSGTYNLKTSSLISAVHSLYEAKNLTLEDYLTELMKRFVMQLFEDQELVLDVTQIVSEYPFDKIQIKDFVKGERTYGFNLDVNNSRLTQITIQGSSTVIDALTFEQFKAL